jgi:hypothetical protein
MAPEFKMEVKIVFSISYSSFIVHIFSKNKMSEFSTILNGLFDSMDSLMLNPLYLLFSLDMLAEKLNFITLKITLYNEYILKNFFSKLLLLFIYHLLLICIVIDVHLIAYWKNFKIKRYIIKLISFPVTSCDSKK